MIQACPTVPDSWWGLIPSKESACLYLSFGEVSKNMEGSNGAINHWLFDISCISWPVDQEQYPSVTSWWGKVSLLVLALGLCRLIAILMDWRVWSLLGDNTKSCWTFSGPPIKSVCWVGMSLKLVMFWRSFFLDEGKGLLMIKPFDPDFEWECKNTKLISNKLSCIDGVAIKNWPWSFRLFISTLEVVGYNWQFYSLFAVQDRCVATSVPHYSYSW